MICKECKKEDTDIVHISPQLRNGFEYHKFEPASTGELPLTLLEQLKEAQNKLKFHSGGTETEWGCGHGKWNCKGDCVTCLSNTIDYVSKELSMVRQDNSLIIGELIKTEQEIHKCLTVANGRWEEWGDRAMDVLDIIEAIQVTLQRFRAARPSEPSALFCQCGSGQRVGECDMPHAKPSTPQTSAAQTDIEEKYLIALRWFKLFYNFYQKDIEGKPSAAMSAMSEDSELQELLREADRIR